MGERELAEVERAELTAHELWVNEEYGGRCLDWSFRDLRVMDLQGANLYFANLVGANLQSADLRGANLRLTSLRGANLRYASLWGAELNWASHNLLAEILHQASGFDYRKRAFAGLVAISPDWCWDTPELLDALSAMPDEAAWAIETLAEWVGPDEECGLTHLAAGDYAPDDMPDEDEEVDNE